MADVAIKQAQVEAAPATYSIPGAQEIILKSIKAHFDGTGASGAFVPVLQILEPAGSIVVECPVGTTVSIGASADASWFSGAGIGSGSIEADIALSTSLTISLATTNATSIKASDGVVQGWFLSNQNAATRYIKLYDKASAPTVGTDTPKMTLAIPGGASANILGGVGIQFLSGIALAMTTGVANSDTGAVAANDVVANIIYT